MSNIKNYLQLHHIGILCRITECVITAITLQVNAIELQKSSDIDDGQKSADLSQVEDVPDHLLIRFKEVWRMVDGFVKYKCPRKHCDNYELHVRRLYL